MAFIWTIMWLGCLPLGLAPLTRSATDSTTMAAIKKAHKTAAVDLGALLNAGDSAVVTLVAGDTSLAAHRAILAAKSAVFAAMFSHDMVEASSGEVTIADVEGPVLRQLVAYMYTSRTPQLPGMAPKLLAAADKYGLAALKAACEQQVASQLTVENAAATAVLAVRHSCPSLTEATIDFIKDNFIWVTSTKGWAHAVRTQPEDLIEVTQRLTEPPTEIRNLSLEEKGKRLVVAAKEGKAEEVRLLLAAWADIRVNSENVNIVLHLAASKGHVEVVSSLLEHGAEVDATNSKLNTALHYAAWGGHPAMVRLLVASSADVNIKDINGVTPLHCAAFNGHREVAAMLLEAGADRGLKDDSGRTSLDVAREFNQQQIIDLLTRC